MSARPIKAALTYAQNQEIEKMQTKTQKNDVQKILTAIQNFLNEYSDEFAYDRLNIFAVEAYPNRRTQTAQTAFVLINLTGETINSLDCHLSFEVSDFDVEFSPINLELDEDFLGEWPDGYALMVVDDVPMKGSPTKAAYSMSDINMTADRVLVSNPD